MRRYFLIIGGERFAYSDLTDATLAINRLDDGDGNYSITITRIDDNPEHDRAIGESVINLMAAGLNDDYPNL